MVLWIPKAEISYFQSTPFHNAPQVLSPSAVGTIWRCIRNSCCTVSLMHILNRRCVCVLWFDRAVNRVSYFTPCSLRMKNQKKRDEKMRGRWGKTESLPRLSVVWSNREDSRELNNKRYDIYILYIIIYLSSTVVNRLTRENNIYT